MKYLMIQSVFCKIQNKPHNKDYHDNLCFNKSALFDYTSISYPTSFDSNELEPYPEEQKIEDAKKVCEKFADSGELPFLLLSGDLSGIQDTVYTISSKGALKSLRARSFMLELLCEHMCVELLTACLDGDFEKNRIHVIFSGGGSFSLLLPNRIDVKENIARLGKNINNQAFGEFTGRLFVALSYIEVNRSGLEKGCFRETWLELSDKLEKEKKRRFHRKLENIFHAKYPKEPKQKTNLEECRICRRDDINVSEKNPFYKLEDFEPLTNMDAVKVEANNATVVHSLCYHLFRLGDRLTQAKYIYSTSIQPGFRKDRYICFPDLHDEPKYYLVVNEKKYIRWDQKENVWKINDKEEGTIPFLYANYVRNVADLPEEAAVKEREAYRKDHPDREMKYPEETTASFTGLALPFTLILSWTFHNV